MDKFWIATLVAGFAGIVIGAIWFSPKTFFPVWWRAMGRQPGEEAAGATGPGLAFGLTFAAAFVQALGLTLVISMAEGVYADFGWLEGAAVGSLAGFAFAAASSISHKLFGGISLWVWLIEVGQDIVSLTAMGMIIGAIL